MKTRVGRGSTASPTLKQSNLADKCHLKEDNNDRRVTNEFKSCAIGNGGCRTKGHLRN